MSEVPVVSVLMAVYNGDPFVAEAVTSVLAQTRGDFEFLIVDDGSTDGTRDFLSSIEDPRVRLLCNPRNLGLTPSLNRGLEVARGEFVARIDADDLWEPEKLERHVAWFRARPRVALSGTGYRSFGHGPNEGDLAIPPDDHVALRWDLLLICPYCHSSVMWRRRAVAEAVGAYDENYTYAMDRAMWLRVAQNLEVGTLRTPLTRYRLGEHSMTARHPRIEAEAAAIRREALGELLEELDGWEADDLLPRGERVLALTRGSELPPSMPDIRDALDDLEDLSGAFERTLGLDSGSVRGHRSRWRRALARRLLHEARLRRTGKPGPGSPGELFTLARTLDPRSMLTLRAVRYHAAGFGVRLPGEAPAPP